MHPRAWHLAALAGISAVACSKGASTSERGRDARLVPDARPKPAPGSCADAAEHIAAAYGARGVEAPILHDVVLAMTSGCDQERWPDRARQCFSSRAPAWHLDHCRGTLPPHAGLALLHRLQQAGALALPPIDPIRSRGCLPASSMLAGAWTLEASRSSPARATVPFEKYTAFFNALQREIEEACDETEVAALDCLIGLRLPEETRLAARCVARLPAAMIALLQEQRAELEGRHLLPPRGACAKAGDVMAQLRALDASKQPRASAVAWELEHVEELRAQVVASCERYQWDVDGKPALTCLLALRLPDQAASAEGCLGRLSGTIWLDLNRRIEEHEALRDEAIEGLP